MTTSRKTIRIHSLLEMKDFASEYLMSLQKKETGALGRAIIVGLSGDLGSGKTTFSQFVAEDLGVTDRVTSPTFVIEKIYKTNSTHGFERFVHIDAYRLESGAELNTLGFQELLESKDTLIFIEWPSKVNDVLPQNTEYIEFEFIDETTRLITC